MGRNELWIWIANKTIVRSRKCVIVTACRLISMTQTNISLYSHSRSSCLNLILIFMTSTTIIFKIMHKYETNWIFFFFIFLSLQRDSVCISLLHRTRLEFFSYKLQWRWCRLCSRSTRKSFESESNFIFYLLTCRFSLREILSEFIFFGDVKLCCVMGIWIFDLSVLSCLSQEVQWSNI
jgi:hypothetical protein